MLGILIDLLRYRAFIQASIWREIQSQYQGSLFGIAWVFISPLTMLAIYTLVFSGVMGNRLPGNSGTYSYSIFLCAALLPWGFFTDGISRLTNVFVAQGGLIKKASFPRICLPVISLGGAVFNLAIITGVFWLFLLAIDQFPGWTIWQILPVLIVQTILMAGLGMFLGTVNVFFRDVGQLVGVAFQLWFWLTPIVYPLTSLPPWVRPLVQLNPFTTLADLYQTTYLTQQPYTPTQWQHLGLVFALALITIATGLLIYRRHAAEMAEEF